MEQFYIIYHNLISVPAVQVLILFVLVFLLAFLLTPLLFAVLSMLTAHTKTDLDDKLLKILNRPVFWSIVFAGLLFSIRYFSFHASLELLIRKIVFSALIFAWVKPFTRVTNLLLHKNSTSKRGFIKPATLPLFKNMSLVIIWSFAIYFAFYVWGISLTAWLASAGIVGIAVGFAAKDTLANLISGIFILADSPYKVGDIIRLNSGERGEVLHVGLRSTRIKTYDGVEITVPNSKMGNEQIFNETGTHVDRKIRLRIPVSVAYDTDIEKAEQILIDIARSFDVICDDPEPQVRLLSFGDSSLDMELRVWMPEPGRLGGIKDKINRKVLDEFRKADIEIPYPQRDIHLLKD